MWWTTNEGVSAISNQQMQLNDNQLADIVGRELLQPLQSIQLLAQVLAERDLDDAVTTEKIEQLRMLSRRTIKLVESLLILKNDGLEQQRKTLNLSEVVAEAINEIIPRTDTPQLRVFARPLRPLSTSRQHVMQIVKTILTVDSQPQRPQPIEIRFTENGASQTVDIRDYNSQLTMKSWQRLTSHQFASMVQPMAQGGSGFDLFVAMQLAKRLGGELSFEPKQKGNSFQLRLPALYQPEIWQAAQW